MVKYSRQSQDSGCFLVGKLSAPLLFICLCARSSFCSTNRGAPRVPPILFQGEDEEGEKQTRKDDRREMKEKKQKKEVEEKETGKEKKTQKQKKIRKMRRRR